MSRAYSGPNPVLLEVFKNRFSAICEEMGAALTKTAFSPNIKERRDHSSALFDAAGDMLAQAAHIPVHLGSMPLSVKAAIAAVDLGPGDMAVLNDPYRGGTHLPDITLVAPVFAGGEAPAFYVANRAHHADVGGMTGGSMPLSSSLYQEGLVSPPLRLVRAGEVDRALMDLILANVRTPAEREGDFAAQVMANRTGVRRMEELLAAQGADAVADYARHLTDYSEAMVRQAIAALPDGDYHHADLLDGDGLGVCDVAVDCRLSIAGESAELDFTASGDQVPGSVNAVRAITVSAVLYVFRCLAERDIPTNAGCLRPLNIVTREGSVLDARFPAAVAGGNVETSQRVVDAVLGALAQAAPELVPAASQGTMNNTTIAGTDTRPGPKADEPFAYYETLAGGMGAAKGRPGAAAVHSHMTNTLNTPAEALEYAYPLRVTRYAVRRGSGGAGAFPGGDGLIREIEALAPCEVTVLSERREHAPWGLAGGEPGSPGRNVLVTPEGEEPLPGKCTRRLKPGERLRIETPGGGGWGDPA